MCLRYMHKDHHSNPWQAFHQIRFTNRVEFWAGHLWEGFAWGWGWLWVAKQPWFPHLNFYMLQPYINLIEIRYYIFNIYNYIKLYELKCKIHLLRIKWENLPIFWEWQTISNIIKKPHPGIILSTYFLGVSKSHDAGTTPNRFFYMITALASWVLKINHLLTKMIAYPWKPQTKQYGQSMAYIPWVPPQDPSTGESQGPIKQTKLQWRRSSGRPPPESLKKKIQIRDERFFFYRPPWFGVDFLSDKCRWFWSFFFFNGIKC